MEKEIIENNNNTETGISNKLNSLNIDSIPSQKVELDMDKLKHQDYSDNRNHTKCVIIMGMAGSGKTTFVNKFEEEVLNNNQENYIINLDPAVYDCLYEPNMDIRDTINYKEVMKTHNLGPNGAIMTSLNLFSTNIHKVIDVLEKKKLSSGSNNNNDTEEEKLDYIVVDTPGQLEVFSWSASGKLISDSLALIYPTTLIYVVDLVRNQNPNTFVSNMLYALSIMYKMQLPLVVVFNKKDVVKEDVCLSWMKDYTELQAALDSSSDYISTFSNSLCLTLEEFYKTIDVVSVSSKTGEGFKDLFKVLENIEKDYNNEKEKSC